MLGSPQELSSSPHRPTFPPAAEPSLCCQIKTSNRLSRRFDRVSTGPRAWITLVTELCTHGITTADC